MKHTPNCKNLLLKHFFSWNISDSKIWIGFVVSIIEFQLNWGLSLGSVYLYEFKTQLEVRTQLEHLSSFRALSKPNSVAIPDVIPLVDVDCSRLVRSSLRWSLCVLFCMNRQLWRKTTFWCWICRLPDYKYRGTISRNPNRLQTTQSSWVGLVFRWFRLLFECGLSMQRGIECQPVMRGNKGILMSRLESCSTEQGI